MSFAEKFYSDKTSGLHRYNTEEFYAKEAREKLYHLGAGRTMLDFGCGTADLLVYYARHYDSVLGSDLSDNMIDRARARVTAFGLENVELIVADDRAIWQRIGNRTFDIITTAGVVQHLSPQRLETLIVECAKRLEPGGRIVFFDAPDPRLSILTELGLLTAVPQGVKAIPITLWRIPRILVKRALGAVRGEPVDILGYRHHPHSVLEMCRRAGLEAEVVSSMYYEYRYHVLMRLAVSAGSARDAAAIAR